MHEVWITPAGNLRVFRQASLEYTNKQALTQYFTDIAERRYNFTIKYGYEYLGEL
jgi:hypothetical protein